jgi:hypothetical protein
MKEQLIIAYTSIIPLIIWKLNYKINCLSLIIPLLILIILFINTFNLKKNVKVCFANCYFNKKTKFYKFFTESV